MLELLCRGRPSLIEPLIFRLAMRLGLITAAVTGWPTSDHYRILRLAHLVQAADPIQIPPPAESAQPVPAAATTAETPVSPDRPAGRETRQERPDQPAGSGAGGPDPTVQPLGLVELQEIPGDRTLVALVPVALPNPALEGYAQMLIQELLRLDFLAPPDRPKEPIGFHLKPDDLLEGARLLETFDAVNSVELGRSGLAASKSVTQPPPTTTS